MPQLPGLTSGLTSADWNRRVWSLSWPIILSNLSVPLAGAIDTAVVGHLPEPVFIGAVGIAALIFSFLYWSFAFLRMGTTGLIAQYQGAGDLGELHATTIRALLLGTAIGLTLVVLQVPIGEFTFFAIDGSAEMEFHARAYYDVRIWGAPAGLVNWAVLGFLFGVQRMKIALLVQVLLNGMNIVLDLLFVVGFGWDVEGVALATVISEVSAAALGLWFVRRILVENGTTTQWHDLLALGALKTLLVINFDLMVRTVLALLVFMHFMAVSAEISDLVLAVNTVLMHFFSFLSYGLDGFANAVEALGGNAYGRRDRVAFRAAVKASTIAAGYVAAGVMVIYLLFGGFLIDLMTNIPEVRELARVYLPWLIALPLLSVWSFQLDGIFVGATHSAEMRNGMLISFATYLLGTWLAVPVFANHGLWLAIVGYMLSRTLTLGLWYPRIDRAMR